MSNAKKPAESVARYREAMKKRREMFLKARLAEMTIIEALTKLDETHIAEITTADDTPQTVN